VTRAAALSGNAFKVACMPLEGGYSVIGCPDGRLPSPMSWFYSMSGALVFDNQESESAGVYALFERR
jgi:hypothetical protein